MTETEQAISKELKAAIHLCQRAGTETKDYGSSCLTPKETVLLKTISKVLYGVGPKGTGPSVNVSKTDWIQVSDGKVVDMDLSLYALLATRLKAAPAFDKLDSSAPENDEFGTSDGTPRHFTRFSMDHRTDLRSMVPDKEARLINPFPSFRKRKEKRHRTGGSVMAASIGILLLPFLLNLPYCFKNAARTLILKVAWGKGHAGDYDLSELFDWLDGICRS